MVIRALSGGLLLLYQYFTHPRHIKWVASIISRKQVAQLPEEWADMAKKPEGVLSNLKEVRTRLHRIQTVVSLYSATKYVTNIGQTFCQNLSSWKRWLRRSWRPKSEHFQWKSKTKLPNTKDQHKEQQEGRWTFSISVKTKQCLSIWTAASEDLTLWHRMKNYMYQELWAARCTFQEKKQLAEPVCPEQVHFYSRGWIVHEQKVWCLPSQLITCICCLSLETLVILLDMILSISEDYRSQGWKCQSPLCPRCPHTQYLHSREQSYKGSVQSTAWVCMGENGIEAKAEGEMQAIVVVRQIWNQPVIPSQKDKNENGFELAGKACADAAREACL